MAANQYLTLSSGTLSLLAANQTSAGTGDAGKLVALNASGVIDSSMISSSGGGALSVSTQTADFMATANSVYFINTDTGITATLPDATTCEGQPICFVSAHTGVSMAVTLSGEQTIDGSTSTETIDAILGQGVGASVTIISDGSNWTTRVYNTPIATNSPLGLSYESGAVLIELTPADIDLSTLGGSLDLTSQVTGTLPHNNGGTDVTSPGTSGNVLTSDGTNWTSSAPPSAVGGAVSVTVTAGADITGGQLINVYNNAGTLTAIPADNTTGPSQAMGWAPADISNTDTGVVNLAMQGDVVGLSDLTPGTQYFLGTAGGVTDTAPSSSGDLIQPVGVAISATELVMMLGPATVIS